MAFKAKYESIDRDSTIIIIPAVMNLVEKSSQWFSIPISERRQIVLDFISYPILADYEVLDLNTGERFISPEGMLKKTNDSPKKHFIGPITHNIWYYETIQVPLVNYLRKEKTQHVFWVPNLGIGEDYGRFWIIKDDMLYVLVLDTIQGTFYPIGAIEFLNNVGDDYFKLVGDN